VGVGSLCPAVVAFLAAARHSDSARRTAAAAASSLVASTRCKDSLVAAMTASCAVRALVAAASM
jgi:hypothetical protein